ncbi:MAG: endonuclease III [Opitutaceae bacterium]|jgi:endonuclease-3|nr:endonuclease III [Opitutaceae bacterium]
MTQQERAKIAGRMLAEAFPRPAIPLRHRSAFELLVAVVLSAQCTDKRVNLVTPALFARARTPAAMARMSVAEIDGLVRSCGLAPRKAEALQGLSRLIAERHGGRVPRTFAELEALPGVGHKTASVVMSQAFGEAALPVDTHIHRLARRWRLSAADAGVTAVERDLKRLFPKGEWNRLHLRMIYWGRTFCTARGCDGHVCAICKRLNGEN